MNGSLSRLQMSKCLKNAIMGGGKKLYWPFRSFHSQYNNYSDQFQKLLENPSAHVHVLLVD